MRLFRLYTGADQQSHVEELKMEFTPGQIAEQTALQPASGVMFTRMAPGAFVDWHNAPRRQYVITLAGGVEIGLGDGSTHQFGPGEVILAEDLTGKGHTTRAIGDQARLMMIVPLKDIWPGRDTLIGQHAGIPKSPRPWRVMSRFARHRRVPIL